jgi:NADH dehydrogenase
MIVPQTNLPRVVVVGGGFGGLHLVKKLSKTNNFQIVMLDKHNYHTFQPLLYQVSTSGLEPDSIAYPLRKTIINTPNTYFRLAQVETVDARHKTLKTNKGSINFDYLVIATGSKTNYFGNENIAKHAMFMKTVPQALNIRSLILENLEQAIITSNLEKRKSLLNFVIVGGGPTGVELCGALAELKRGVIPKDYPDMNMDEMQIHLLEGADRVLPPMSKKASKDAQIFLENLGVQIHLETLVKDYDGKQVITNNSLRLETETLIWSAGVTGNPIPGLGNEVLVKGNRYKVNHFNQIEGHESIFAIGDIAQMSAEGYENGHPMVAQPAIQQGEHLAKNLVNLVKAKTLIPFKYRDKGTMATIGRNKAVVDLKKGSFSGFFAWLVWMFVHLWFLVGFRNRIVTFFNWVYAYISFDKAARLIIRPFKSVKN